MPVLVVAAVVLGIWYVSRRWEGSKGPELVERVAGVLRWVWKGALGVLAVAAVAAMAQGCDGREPSSGGPGEPCTAYRAEECGPGGLPTTTYGGLDLDEDVAEPEYAPCPAFHEEDCPIAPAGP